MILVITEETNTANIKYSLGREQGAISFSRGTSKAPSRDGGRGKRKEAHQGRNEGHQGWEE